MKKYLKTIGLIFLALITLEWYMCNRKTEKTAITIDVINDTSAH